MERFYDAGGSAERDHRRVADRKRKATARRRVFAHYGTSCACCGTTENLTIDHVNGGGKQHRDEIGENSHAIYRWLIKNNFPSGFQVLCAPCNLSKSDGERCRMHDSRKVVLISKAIRMPNDLLAWFADHSAATGLSVHDSIVAALTDFRTLHSTSLDAKRKPAA